MTSKDDARTQFVIVSALSCAFLFMPTSPFFGSSAIGLIYDKLIMFLLGAGFVVSHAAAWKKE